jgi:TonB family protein
MPSPAPLAQVFLYFLFSILLAQPPQNTTPTSPPHIHITQDQLCCFTTCVVNPIYPREARLANTEGAVKLTLVIAKDGSVAELEAVSGDPLLLESAMKAVRQWRFLMEGWAVGGPSEKEVPLSFTFKIEDPRKPAYLHLDNRKVIRADTVRKFSDRIVYTVGQGTHYISPASVTDVTGCARLPIRIPARECDCIPAGGPSFDIIAIPLLPADKSNHTGHSA